MMKVITYNDKEYAFITDTAYMGEFNTDPAGGSIDAIGYEISQEDCDELEKKCEYEFDLIIQDDERFFTLYNKCMWNFTEEYSYSEFPTIVFTYESSKDVTRQFNIKTVLEEI